MRDEAAHAGRPRHKAPHVALIVETSLAPGRDMLRGIARYIRAQGPWSTLLEPRSLEELVPNWLRRWKGDGIIARVQNRKIAKAVLAAGIPAVDVLGAVRIPRLPLIHTDDAQISVMAAEHLLDRGYRHFGYVGLPGESWSNHRRDAFAAVLKSKGLECKVYETRKQTHHARQWEEYAAELAAWIAVLPKPAGLMLCSDQIGPVALEACRRARVEVPDEVAVIGVDNDEPLCEVADPGLSSVWPDHERVGYEAAALLDRMMHGARAPEAPIYLAPRMVVARRSSDALALEDRDMAAAVRRIRDRACQPQGLSIVNVADAGSISKSMLQRRFKRATGRTLHDEMLRVRLERARELLAESDLPIAKVAEKAGFRHQEYLGVVFRIQEGTTPARFRQAHRR